MPVRRFCIRRTLLGVPGQADAVRKGIGVQREIRFRASGKALAPPWPASGRGRPSPGTARPRRTGIRARRPGVSGPPRPTPSSRERRPEATACGVRSAQVTWCRYETSRLFSPTRHNAPVSSVPDWRMMKLSLAIIMLSGQGCTSKEGRRKVSRMRTRTSPLSLRDWSVRSGMSSSRTCSSGMRRADCTSMRLAGRSRGTRVTCP